MMHLWPTESVQRRLRDPTERNQLFSKVSVTGRQPFGKDFILCGFEDLGFEDFYFIIIQLQVCWCNIGLLSKTRAKHVLSKECARLYNLYYTQVEATRQNAIRGGMCTRESTRLARPGPLLPGLTFWTVTARPLVSDIFALMQNCDLMLCHQKC